MAKASLLNYFPYVQIEDENENVGDKREKSLEIDSNSGWQSERNKY